MVIWTSAFLTREILSMLARQLFETRTTGASASSSSSWTRDPRASSGSSMDKDVWRKAGMWQARAWRATGVRCDLGPQIDVYSNPIGTRTSGSVSEDPALNRDFAAAFGGGMQSTWGDDEATDDKGWGDQSCAVMLKHFVGEGSNEGGRDDHSDSGKWNVFPGGNFDAHLVPFLDGGMHLDSKTEQMAAVMPCYGIAYDPNDPDGLGEHVGSAYSKHNISILRNTGWDGMICTDWMILDGIQHGMKDKTVPERYAKLMNNTISICNITFFNLSVVHFESSFPLIPKYISYHSIDWNFLSIYPYHTISFHLLLS